MLQLVTLAQAFEKRLCSTARRRTLSVLPIFSFGMLIVYEEAHICYSLVGESFVYVFGGRLDSGGGHRYEEASCEFFGLGLWNHHYSGFAT